jgi:putative membrane protein
MKPMPVLILSVVSVIGTLAGCSTERAATQAAGNPDQHFMVTAALSNLSEVQTGRLALERSGNSEVRRFAQMMIDHHTGANRQLEALASRKGVTMPGRPDEAHAADAAHLAELHGPDFDREYMGLMVGEHAKAVSLFEDKAGKTADPEIRAYAQRTVKDLQEHLRMARDLNGRLTGPGAVR